MLVLALGALALLAYTYLGYPIAVAVLARLFPLRVRSDPAWRPAVTVCVPLHNAAPYVAGKLDSLLAQDYPADKIDFLLFADGSTDESMDLVSDYVARDPRIRVVMGETRRGKPNALNVMSRAAAGEVLVLTDIRQPLGPGAVAALVAGLADPRVACASGNLVLRGESGASIYWRYENWIRRSEASFRSMVGITGPLYAIRHADLPEVPEDTLLDDMWVPMKLRLAGRRIVLCEKAVAYDEAFADGREFGRKVRTLAGNYQLFARLPGLLLPLVNPSWFETFSHKVLRLVCPWALVALFGASVVGVLRAAAGAELWILRALIAGQLVFCVAALAGPRGGRLGKTARTFAVLHWAAVVGLWRWLRGAQKVTW